MARASIKEDLLEDMTQGFEDLKLHLALLDPDKDFDFEDRDKNPRDILAHLFEWQNMFFSWHHQGTVEGIQPAIPAEGYTWTTTGALNEGIRLKYLSESFESMLLKLDQSHQSLLTFAQNQSNQQLYARNVYAWTRDSVLGSYLSSASASHYEWAIKKLKKQIRLNKKKK